MNTDIVSKGYGTGYPKSCFTRIILKLLEHTVSFRAKIQAVTAVYDIVFSSCLLLVTILCNGGCGAIIYTARYCREL
jgi:hypothetical protein